MQKEYSEENLPNISKYVYQQREFYITVKLGETMTNVVNNWRCMPNKYQNHSLRSVVGTERMSSALRG